MENTCQGSNTKMFLSSLTISAVIEELSHILNENKSVHFHQSFPDKNLETIFDFFCPLVPVSSLPLIKSWWFYFQNIFWVWLLLSIFTATIPVPAWTTIIDSGLGMHSAANNRKLNWGSFDK